MTTIVRLETRAVGVHFGYVGVARDVRTGREIYVTERVYPHGCRHVAWEAVRSVAQDRGWSVSS